MVRYLVAFLGLLVVIGGLVGIKASQISGLIKAGEAFAKAGPPPESVSTDVARELVWEGTLSAVGNIAASRGVTVSNEVAGMVKRIAFESGAVVKAGQMLLDLDTSVERAQLATATARRQLAEQTVKRTRALSQSGTVSQSALDGDEAAFRSASAEVDALRAQIDRKIVRAPFAGRLGIRAVNLGQYLAPGTTITTLESLDTVYVDFTLPQQALSSLKLGLPIRVTLESEPKAVQSERESAPKVVPLEGQIAAIDPALDPATRSIRVRAGVPNEEQKLRPGMFANVSVVLPERGATVAIPLTAVVHAPYGDSVFVVEALKEQPPPAPGARPVPAGGVKQVRQQFVRLGEERGDFVAVLDGVSPGQELVSAGAFKLRNGARVTINNKTKPEPKLDPRPENR